MEAGDFKEEAVCGPALISGQPLRPASLAPDAFSYGSQNPCDATSQGPLIFVWQYDSQLIVFSTVNGMIHGHFS
jgi:hypothetical protein